MSSVGNSSRTFNFDVFPSELFGRVDVYKSPLANLEEGGISGNVDLQTPRPFDSKGRVVRYNLAQNYNTGSGQIRPRASLLVSDTVGNFGALLEVCDDDNDEGESENNDAQRGYLPVSRDPLSFGLVAHKD